jgi:hypothetical protein
VDLHLYIPLVDKAPNKETLQYLGTLGDYIGGVLGTVIALIGIPLLVLTWRATLRTDYRAKVYAVFTEILKTHDDIVASLNFNNLLGRDVFALMLSEFHAIYQEVNVVNASRGAGWSLRDKIDIAFTITFFGSTITASDELSHFDPSAIKDVNDLASKLKNKSIKTDRLFRGHQNRLSHYYRNLFAAYTFVDSTKLPNDEKLALGKVIRAKTTNSEQALLALNIVSHLGREWETEGIAGKYKVIKNLPRRYFMFDNTVKIKDLFPYIDYEWEKRGAHAIRSSHLALGPLDIYIHRRIAQVAAN